jgi:hypothetical protein
MTLMNDTHYGWVVNTHYEWMNMLVKMKESKPDRFKEFDYSHSTIYHYLDKIQQEQNLYD